MKVKKTMLILFAVGLLLSLYGCTEVPSLGSIAPDIRYKNRKQYTISGTQQEIGEFLSSTSTLPLNFELVRVWETNGGEVSALNEELPIVSYNTAIVGGESEEELRLKSDTVLRPAITLNAFSGKIEIVKGNNIPAGEYHFDIRVSNSSGDLVLNDAIVIEFIEHEVKAWSSGMERPPEIERIADSPNQIRFVGHLQGAPLGGDRIDFTVNRSTGFKGRFMDDTPDGELWGVDFPVLAADTYCTWQLQQEVNGATTTSYVTENFNFVLGRPGSYVIKLYK